MRFSGFKAFLLIGLVFFAACTAQLWLANAEANEAKNLRAQRMTQAYQAEYDLTRRGRTHGKAGRVLTYQGEQVWQYSTFTEASLLFLSDRRYQETQFQLQGDRVQPLAFYYQRTGTGAGQVFRVQFDYQKQQLVPQKNNTEFSAHWQEGILDANAVLHQLQIDVAGKEDEWCYNLIDEDGQNVEYRFRRMAYETIQVPYGTLETIRVMRVRETNRRETYFWFSPLHNYTLVQMQQLKAGKEEAKLVLRSLTRG